MSISDIFNDYPLHVLVWKNDHENLEKELQCHAHDIEKRDPRGRTPLMLALTMRHIESSEVLLRFNAEAIFLSKEGFTPVGEAVAIGNPALVKLALQRKLYQEGEFFRKSIPDLIRKINGTPDFYTELKWELSSWVPLVGKWFPSDTCKVYKSGLSVRIDTTLLDVDEKGCTRGNRSYIFKGMEDGSALFYEVDHDSKKYYLDSYDPLSSGAKAPSDGNLPAVNEKSVISRLTRPVSTATIDFEKIRFERRRTGIWGYKTDKVESINGYECKVFSALDVELVTKWRLEHLSEDEKEKFKKKKILSEPMKSLIGKYLFITETTGKNQLNCPPVMLEEYLDPLVDISDRNIGHPKELLSHTYLFQATLWFCENFPLTLAEQVMPIIDLMAMKNTLFAKLRDFITLKLPPGFPVKIEIPLFYILNAKVTFGNIFGNVGDVTGVKCFVNGAKTGCKIDDSLFFPPQEYSQICKDEPLTIDEDELVLQYAIHQSLSDQGDCLEDAKLNKPQRGLVEEDSLASYDETTELQKAIHESLLFGLADFDANPIFREKSTNSAESEEFQRAVEESLNCTFSPSSPRATNAVSLSKDNNLDSA